jgi:regulatory protein
MLAEKLARRGFATEVITPLLDRFTEVGLIDDATYASALVRTHGFDRGRGRRMVAQVLKRSGVSEDICTAALEQITDADEFAAAIRIATRSLARGGAGTDPLLLYRRAMGALQRRGFTVEVARGALQHALKSEPVDSPGFRHAN